MLLHKWKKMCEICQRVDTSSRWRPCLLRGTEGSWSEWRLGVGRAAKLENLLGSINMIQLEENEGGGAFSSSFFYSVSDMHIICGWQWSSWEQRWKDFIAEKEWLSSHPFPVLKFLLMPYDSLLDSMTSFQKTNAKMSTELEFEPGCDFM